MMEQPASESQRSFPATRWTIIRRMGDQREVVKLQGWDEFVRVYWPGLVSWLESRGVTSANAQDLVQGFLEKLWKSADFTERLDPAKGRLRSFLFAALKNWHSSQLTKQGALRRGGGQPDLVLEESQLAELDFTDDDHLFDQAWARAVFRNACQRLRLEYEARDDGAFFDLGLAILDDRNSEDLKKLAERLEMKSNSLNVALKRLRERLASRLREEILATLVSPTQNQIDEELRHLLRSFGACFSFTDLAGQVSSSGEKSVE